MPPAGIHDLESECIDRPIRRSSSVIRPRKSKAVLESKASVFAAYRGFEARDCCRSAASLEWSDSGVGTSAEGIVRRVKTVAAISAAPKPASDFDSPRNRNTAFALTANPSSDSPIPPRKPMADFGLTPEERGIHR